MHNQTSPMPPTPQIKYHPDHLGSASWITDAGGQPIQHLQYLPYGETLLDQRNGGYQERYTFSGKEKDSETGYHYFGSRYYNSDLSLWFSVDPMSDKYPSLSPYNYCAWNPMKIVDPDGAEIGDYYDKYGNYLGTDGVEDNKLYLVTDESEINRIIDNNSNCDVRYTNASTVDSKLQLLSHKDRNEILDYLEESHKNTPNREYGGVAIQQKNNTVTVAHFEPGAKYKQGESGQISNTIIQKDMWMLKECYGEPLTRFHSHGICNS